tara:strand:+ start:113 stop:985 length:873 start_codon:yes stop_codon:yes gene_type:complete
MTSQNYKTLTIVIVIYNSSNAILDLLNNLKNFKIIIVDNGRNDHIIDKIKTHQNITNIISKNINIGFGKGVNLAFEKISSDYFLVLNPDITINEENINNLLDIIIKNEDCGIVSPLIIPDKDSFGAFPEKGKGINRNVIEKKSSQIQDKILPEGHCCVDVTKGCVLLIRSKHFRKVGMFDEKFFLFWEEIDLCKRFRKEKLSVIMAPEIKVTHNEGSSVKKNIRNFIIRNYYKELSPLIYFNVNKFNSSLYLKMIKYFLRTFAYLVSFNFKKSLSNVLKLSAIFNYLILK